MTVEEKGLEALALIEAEIGTQDRDLRQTAASLCASYQKIKGPMASVLELVGKFPFVGSKVVNTIKFLMTIADGVCEQVAS